MITMNAKAVRRACESVSRNVKTTDEGFEAQFSLEQFFELLKAGEMGKVGTIASISGGVLHLEVLGMWVSIDRSGVKINVAE